MKYGKRLRDEIERCLPEWRGEFISYKQLKKQLNLIDPVSRAKKRSAGISIEDFFLAGNGRVDVNFMKFNQLLDVELHKVNTFYIDKEEDHVIRLKVHINIYVHAYIYMSFSKFLSFFIICDLIHVY